jgi:transcriptional regulator with XRE-family HTH domain
MDIAAANVVYERIKNSRKLSKLSQETIAKKAKIHQSQVSRILNGKFARVSKNVIRICKFAKIPLAKEQPLSPKLQKALEGVWDGSLEQEAALVKLLDAASGMALARSISST